MGNSDIQYCDDLKSIIWVLNNSPEKLENYKYATIAILRILMKLKINNEIMSHRIDKIERDIHLFVTLQKDINSKFADRLNKIEQGPMI
jgi:CII-binding regulator of phage lambda lysogenization HflD